MPLAEAAARRAGSAKKMQSSLAMIYSGAGVLSARRAAAARSPSARVAHCQVALLWLRKSQGVWQQMRTTGTLSGAYRAQPDTVAAEIDACSR
jgi:hypothetical protein